jgi:hypothetical protein
MENSNQKNDVGRPSVYTQDVVDEILARLANGETLRAICKEDHLPKESTVRRWAVDDVNGFFAHYAKAREIGYHTMADELLEVADDGRNDWMERNGDDGAGWQANGEHLQRSRLRVDTRKWLLSKALPKVYGDKAQLDHTSSDGSFSVIVREFKVGE